jgi:hypothetical protein
MKQPWYSPGDGLYSLGKSAKKWLNGFFTNLYCTGLTAGALITTNSLGKLIDATAVNSTTVGLTTPLAATFTELLYQNLGYATHSYGNAHSDWTLSTAEAECFHLNMTAADQAVNAVVPALRKAYFISNASGQTVTVKAASGSTTSVANGKFAVVYFDGTNLVRLVADT